MEIWSVKTNRSTDGDEIAKLFLENNCVYMWNRVAEGKRTFRDVKLGDLILAYHNEKKIIAVGFALSLRKVSDESEWEEFVEVDWICKNLEEPIMLDNIQSENNEVALFVGAILNWTENIDTKKLLSEIGKKKSLKMIEKR